MLEFLFKSALQNFDAQNENQTKAISWDLQNLYCMTAPLGSWMVVFFIPLVKCKLHCVNSD